jgi:ribonuclease D
MSNWENKPLRKAQLKYAALDSFVLIQIHDFIQNRCKELNMDFDYINRGSFL